MAIGQAMGIAQGCGEAVQCIREFIEDPKASGLIARVIKNAGICGVASVPKSMSSIDGG